MRVLHLADLHISLSGPRREECIRILDWISGNVHEVKASVVVIAGDIFDRRSTPAERIYLAQFLRALSAAAPVVAIRGNHDDPEDLSLFKTEYGWRLPVDVLTEPAVINRSGVVLACLPWPELGRLVVANATDSIATRRETARSALVDVLRGFRLQIESGSPSLLVVHMPIVGASMDSGQPVSSSEEIALSTEELLESECRAVLAGHIHLRQEMRSADGRPVWYAGAPFRGSFGEAKGTKGGLIWDWTGKAWEVMPWEVPARSMVLIERAFAVDESGQFVPAGGAPPEWDIIKDSDVRFRVSFPAGYREAMREATAPEVEAIKAVAHQVVVEERTQIISRTRCVEIAAARTTTDKLHAWAQAVGAEIPAGADAKLGILEGGLS